MLYNKADPNKAKVNKNLQRFAEDSLDRRLRQARNDGNQADPRQAPRMQHP